MCFALTQFMCTTLILLVVYLLHSYNVPSSGGRLTVTGSHTPGSLFQVGETLVQYTATDAAGNSRTCNLTVAVQGITPSDKRCFVKYTSEVLYCATIFFPFPQGQNVNNHMSRLMESLFALKRTKALTVLFTVRRATASLTTQRTATSVPTMACGSLPILQTGLTVQVSAAQLFCQFWYQIVSYVLQQLYLTF